MIHLDRPDKTPQALLNRGRTATREDCEAYDGNRAAYANGELKFNFNNKIYGSPEVRCTLKKVQHDKCCYCETKTSPGSPGRIDHFRPKGAVRQGEGSDRLYPGYFWLAYRWDNLVLACETCNRMKSDYFPLEESEQRVRNPRAPLERESPLLLNPYAEADLSEHLTFDGSACKPESERGRATVRVLGLNRPTLQDSRQSVHDILEILCKIVRRLDVPDDVRRCTRLKMDSFARPDAPYSAMARDFLSVAAEDPEDRT